MKYWIQWKYWRTCWKEKRGGWCWCSVKSECFCQPAVTAWGSLIGGTSGFSWVLFNWGVVLRAEVWDDLSTDRAFCLLVLDLQWRHFHDWTLLQLLLSLEDPCHRADLSQQKLHVAPSPWNRMPFLKICPEPCRQHSLVSLLCLVE